MTARSTERGTGERAQEQAQAQKLARAVAGAVTDPELPYLTLDDLGVLRDVAVTGPGRIQVTVTPTFLGCPATAVIQRDIETALRGQGWADVDVALVHQPPWTPDRITDRGRAKLAAEGFGIPARFIPGSPAGANGAVSVTIGRAPTSPAAPPMPCPQCGAADTAVLSPFGAAPCQELRRCTECGEPFPALRPVNTVTTNTVTTNTVTTNTGTMGSPAAMGGRE
jgi:ring-1,2-phenylacetyl-CoA epoxidase subunit PaaD